MNKKPRCFCDATLLDNGKCMYGCTPEMRPSYQRKLRNEEKKRQASRAREQCVVIRRNDCITKDAKVGYASMLRKNGLQSHSWIEWCRNNNGAGVRKASK